MGILFGLLTAICFGLSDFAVTQATRHIGVLQAMLAIQIGGVLIVGVVLVITGQVPAQSPGTWALMAGIALLNFVGIALLYRSFTLGMLSLVSPIASSFAVVTAVLALSTGERPPVLTLLGTFLLIVGVVVVSRAKASTGSPSLAGIPEALGAALSFGVYFWSLKQVTPLLGEVWPVWVTRLVMLIGTLLMLSLRRSFKLGWTWKILLLLLMASMLESIGYLSFNLGISETYTTITTALASLYSAVTVLLAWLFLRERLSRAQTVGIAVVLAGVLFVSL